MTIYAHRRPVAQFSVGFTGLDSSGNYLTSVSDNSYDPDHTSRTDKGIAARQWKWKNINDSTWTSGALPSALAPNQTYLVELTVQDIDGPGGLGAWSYPAVQTITTTGNNFPPAVDCSPQSQSWTNSNVSVNVTATDPTPDLSYVNYEWSTSPAKPTSGWTKQTATNNASYSFSTSQSGEGIWYLHMEAFDTAGNSFYKVRGPYEIDKTPLVIDANPASGSGATSVTISASDAASGLGSISYEWSTSTNKPSSGWTTVNCNGSMNYSSTISNPADGNTYYLHMQATDQAGNTYYRYRGPYVNLAITNVSLSGYWNHWRGRRRRHWRPEPECDVISAPDDGGAAQVPEPGMRQD